MWLNVLITLRRGCGLLALAAAFMLLAGAAQATTFNFNGSNVVPTCPLTGTTYNCAALPNAGGNDVVIIASGYKVVVSTNVSFSFNESLQMSGSAILQTTGSNNIDIADIKTSNLAISGGTLTAGGNFKIGNQVQTITASVNAATMSIGSGSNVKITGALTASGQVTLGSHATIVGPISASVVTSTSPVSLTGDVTATSSFQLASGSTLSGNLTAPTTTLDPSSVTVTGNIVASNSLNIGSGNTVNGTVQGGSLTMNASNVVINGGVTMTGDVDIGSSGVINGDLSARNVTMHSSSASINGNAAVNSIYIDWNDSVTKTITCTGPGASGCSCVTSANPNYHPTCGAAPSAVPHHFQINHSGNALTCQPQTVTVTACANAACTAPNFTSNVNVTLQPGGQTFTISGGVNSAATVQAKDPGTYTLSAASSGVSNATTCVNSSGGPACDMVFRNTGLTVTATNHVSMSSGALVTIQAQTSSPGLPSCVPLVTNQTVNIDMACSYQNPTSGTLTVGIGAKNAVCGANAYGATVPVPFTFDANGKATAALQYADVGLVGLSASYATSSLSAVGNGTFYTAPARFRVVATNAASTSFDSNTQNSMPTGVFAKASEAFTLAVTALNYNGVATPNFGKETTASKVKVTPTVNKSDDTPIAAPVPAGTGSSGTLTYAFPAFASGASSASANFDDVGYTKLTVALDDGSATPLPYYLGQPLASFQTSGTLYVARFVPDHFDTALMADSDVSAILPTTHMDCTKALVNPCNADSTRFINSGQVFFLKVTAYNGNATPAVTANYAGALAKLIDLKALKVKGGNDPADLAAGSIAWSGGTANRYTFTAGVGVPPTTGASGDNVPSFTQNTAYPAADVLPSTIYLRASDADSVTSKRSTASSSVEAPLAIVSGRLLVANGYSSPTAPLPVGVTAQYYTSQGYIYNPLLSGTSTAAISSRITFSNCQRDSIAVTCPASLAVSDVNAKLTLSKGTGKFSITAPTPAASKLSRVNVQLYSTPNQLFPYLPSSTGTETFGLYRSGPVIYTREMY